MTTPVSTEFLFVIATTFVVNVVRNVYSQSVSYDPVNKQLLYEQVLLEYRG